MTTWIVKSISESWTGRGYTSVICEAVTKEGAIKQAQEMVNEFHDHCMLHATKIELPYKCETTSFVAFDHIM